ncbi:MAG: acetyl-CoA carboxylase biotin carboxyl carrier protein [bacterium]|nr:acetyl-CoA carboxylase biotin carboxyl carrier protein [bacterium]
MDLKEIKKLIKMVEESEISGLMIEEGSMRVKIQKDFSGQAYAAPVQMMAPAPQQQAPAAPVADAPAAKPASDTAGLIAVKAPMVGTFYSASNPESPAFVKEGDSISSGQVVCIIEAMKLFNEIESDISGRVEKILVKNGDAVEYGQDLFLLRQ